MSDNRKRDFEMPRVLHDAPRTLTIRPQAYHEALLAARQRQTTLDFQAAYADRAGIEGTLSQGIRLSDLRRSRYLGLAKTHLQHVITATAINSLRVGAWLAELPVRKPGDHPLPLWLPAPLESHRHARIRHQYPVNRCYPSGGCRATTSRHRPDGSLARASSRVSPHPSKTENAHSFTPYTYRDAVKVTKLRLVLHMLNHHFQL